MLYYQFGRKDPFPGNADYWEGGTNKVTYTIASVAYNATDANQPHNVPYSVKNPTKFITNSSSYWTYEDQYNPSPYVSSIIWCDPHYSLHGNKSIFDPSPSGWKVPSSYSGLSFNSYSAGIVKINTSLISNGGSVSLMLAGGRRHDTGNLYNVDNIGLYWTSSIQSVSLAWGIYASSDSFNHMNTYRSNLGFSSHTIGQLVIPTQE